MTGTSLGEQLHDGTHCHNDGRPHLGPCVEPEGYGFTRADVRRYAEHIAGNPVAGMDVDPRDLFAAAAVLGGLARDGRLLGAVEETGSADDERLDADEMLLFRAFQAMGCPAPVDPVDPDDCASVAVECIRVLRRAGRLLPDPAEVHTEYAAWCHASDNDDAIRLDEDRLGSLERAHETGRSRIGQYGITRYTVHRREHRVYADGSSWSGPWMPVPAAAEAPA